MIPKKIHYIWLGEGKKSPLSLICIRSWKEKLQGYELYEWNEYNLDLNGIEEKNRFFKECRKRKLWAYMADYLRLYILYQYGGIYFDTDVQAMKNFDDLLGYECLVGLETQNYIGTGVIACEPHNETIKKFLEFYEEEIWNSRLYTIPSIMTYILDKNPNLKVNIFPQEAFAPYNPWIKDMDIEPTDNTYCIHWFNASWADNPAIRNFLSVKHIKNPLFRYAVITKKTIGAVYHTLLKK